MKSYEHRIWRNAAAVLSECLERHRDVLIAPEQEARAEVLRLCAMLSAGEPWRWAVRDVEPPQTWQACLTLDQAMQAAERWEKDGFKPEIVPLFAGRAVQR